jgi:hypothetical protein
VLGQEIGKNRFDEISKFSRENLDINRFIDALGLSIEQLIPNVELMGNKIREFFDIDFSTLIERVGNNVGINNVTGNNIEGMFTTVPIPTISNIVPQPIQSKIEEVQTSIASLTQTNVEEKTTTEKVEGKVDLSGNIYVNVNESQLQGVLSQLFQGEEFKEMVYNSVVGMERKREIFQGTLKSFT